MKEHHTHAFGEGLNKLSLDTFNRYSQEVLFTPDMIRAAALSEWLDSQIASFWMDPANPMARS